MAEKTNGIFERRGAAGIAGRAAAATLLALGLCSPAPAAGADWRLQFELMNMEAHGHDQHVLTAREIDLQSIPRSESKTAVSLDTDSGLAYRGELQYLAGPWRYGADFFWFNTSQGTADRTAAASGPAGPIDEVVFEVADRSYTSSGPGEALFYSVLEDTDLAVWTLDLYAMRTLAEKPDSAIHLQFGLRVGDFDNDYRAVVGLQDVIGSRLDASSNYDRMMGPLVGLAAELRRGRNHLTAHLGQSVIFGSAELTSRSRQFSGPSDSAFPVDGELTSVLAQKQFKAERDVGIPITEIRFKWTYEMTRHLSLGLGANAATWWDVSVPPGVIPTAGGDQVLHENTIVFFGLAGAVELRF